MAIQVWCKKCHSDVEDVHYGNCPDHPNNIALASRVGLPPKLASNTVAQPNEQTTAGLSKAAFFKGESTISFDDDQMKQIVEYFLLNVLDLSGVEVVKLKHSKAGSKVTFSQKLEDLPQEVFISQFTPASPYSEAELEALKDIEDEMARQSKTS